MFNTMLKRWTKSAIDCYMRGCRCNNCLMNKLESKCRMKTTVIELVKILGAPKLKEKREIIYE